MEVANEWSGMQRVTSGVLEKLRELNPSGSFRVRTYYDADDTDSTPILDHYYKWQIEQVGPTRFRTFFPKAIAQISMRRHVSGKRRFKYKTLAPDLISQEALERITKPKIEELIAEKQI